MTWHPRAYSLLLKGDLSSVQQLYEQLIEVEPEVISHYWYLGLVYLLLQQEEQAQATLLLSFSQGDEEEVEQWTTDLVTILDTEAQRQESINNYHLSWLIRGYIQEFAPNSINNLLDFIRLAIALDYFTAEWLTEQQVSEVLQENSVSEIDADLLLLVLKKSLAYPSQETLRFIEASLSYIKAPEAFIEIAIAVAPVSHDYQQISFLADVLQLCLKLTPDNVVILDMLIGYNTTAQRHQQALEAAFQFYQQANTLSLKVLANSKILYLLMYQGEWLQVADIAQRHKALLNQLIETPPQSLDPFICSTWQTLIYPLYYWQDIPKETHWFQKHISQIFQQDIQSRYHLPHSSTFRNKSGRLKIGYIAHTLRRHSIGWLSRWLLHYRNREAFTVGLYLVDQSEDELTQQWFRQKADLTYHLPNDPEAIATQIQQDEVDILVDLDSVTHSITCQVMSLKPAPIQATWLGLDASNLPAIDYYIADRYVLPEDAQDYYQETIWRLPHCYMAVDGFETGVPTLRREHLSIPDEAIIYLSAQIGLKRHPDTIRLQMQILKAVPNSYFLIQGLADGDKIKHLFTQIAEKEGVSPSRLRFLPTYPTETYRANLSIADVVLDTYPFNGGTITIDILWQGIPVVTKVGQQWASRNGYTLLTNAGISEGIAWSDEEYVDWGIKFGIDEQLRQQIAWKLINSRKTSPLWNAQQFTRDLENAYQQMWTRR